MLHKITYKKGSFAFIFTFINLGLKNMLFIVLKINTYLQMCYHIQELRRRLLGVGVRKVVAKQRLHDANIGHHSLMVHLFHGKPIYNKMHIQYIRPICII